MADGGLWSTAEDLGRWLAQQLRSMTVSCAVTPGAGRKNLAKMHRPVS